MGEHVVDIGELSVVVVDLRFPRVEVRSTLVTMLLTSIVILPLELTSLTSPKNCTSKLCGKDEMQ